MTRKTFPPPQPPKEGPEPFWGLVLGGLAVAGLAIGVLYLVA